jgi:hypothetical protein
MSCCSSLAVSISGLFCTPHFFRILARGANVLLLFFSGTASFVNVLLLLLFSGTASNVNVLLFSGTASFVDVLLLCGTASFLYVLLFSPSVSFSESKNSQIPLLPP